MEVSLMRSLVVSLAMLLACTVTFVAGGGSARADHHEGAAAEDPWNQEKAAAAAAKLAAALDGLRTALRQQPPPGTGIAPGGGQRATHQLRDRLRLMESESRHLADELARGASRDETLPTFERVNTIRRDAVHQAQRVFLQQPVKDRIIAARDPLEELAGYYGIEIDRQLRMR
jgi:hypothetical protein